MLDRESERDWDEDDSGPRESSPVDVLRFAVTAIRAHRLLFFLAWFWIVASGTFVAVSIRNNYRSTTTIYVSSTGAITAELTGGSKPRDDSVARGLSETVLSSGNLLYLVQEASLVESYVRTRPWVLRQKARLLAYVFGEPDKSQMERALATVLRQRLTVTFQSPATIAFSADWFEPVKAAALVQLVERNFRSTRKAEEFSAIARAIAILENEVAKTDSEILSADSALREVLARGAVASANQGERGLMLDDPAVRSARMNLAMAEQKARNLRGRLDTAWIERATAEAEFDNRYQVLEPAVVPSLPIRPIKYLVVFGAIVLGFAVSSVLAVVRELQVFKSAHDSTDRQPQMQSASLPEGEGERGGCFDAACESEASALLPRAFLAYPASPPALAETLRNAARKINDSGKLEVRSWEELRVAGKFIIDEILRTIEESDLLIADLTGANANVFFEVGYAIAKRKRVWPLVDRTSGDGGFVKSQVLSTLGHTLYSNSDDILESLFKEHPHQQLDESLYSRLIPADHATTSSLLYLKSEYDTEASVQLTERLREPSFLTVSDGSAGGQQPLDWYGRQIRAAKNVVWHLNSQASGERLALHALAVGLAVGLNKGVLVLCQGSVPAPLDCRHLVRHYGTAAEACVYLDSWLASQDYGCPA